MDDVGILKIFAMVGFVIGLWFIYMDQSIGLFVILFSIIIGVGTSYMNYTEEEIKKEKKK